MNHHYQGKPEKIRRLGEAVSKVIRGIDNRIRETPVKQYIGFKAKGRNLFTMTPTHKKVNLYPMFLLLKDVKNLRQDLWRDLTETQYQERIEFSLRSESDLDEIKEYIVKNIRRF